jgi:CubicO group peptidase (beta-lactamase class C family)
MATSLARPPNRIRPICSKRKQKEEMKNQMNFITPEEVGFASQRLARIKTKMQRYIDEQKLAGISTLIARRGKVVHFEQVGMADIEASTPMAADTIFRIYSMTKPITSVAVLMLLNPFAKSGIEDKNRLRVNSTERGHGVKQLSN